MPKDSSNDRGENEQHVQDLVQRIKLPGGRVPACALLLGAGASVTSGIRTGQQWAEIWVEELHKRQHPDEPYDSEIARRHLASTCKWYSREREFACLSHYKFPSKVDLRRFVENEVAERLPSIGYPYLVRLMESNFVNTVFSTNYDDLLDKAFHLYSKSRLMVYAHDSLAGAAGTLNPRTLFKLHSDYQSEGIKSTPDETKELGRNTRNKLADVARHQGLIVVGHAGNDRSVMDALQLLLTEREYFQGGIYWCLRRGEAPSPEVQRLLGSDHVYLVRIDGFDELMAEIYQHCIGAAPPIKTSILCTTPRDMIARFCADPALQTSPSRIIRDHLAELRREQDREILVDSLRVVTREDERPDREPQRLRDSDLLKLMALQQLIDAGRHDEALGEIAAGLALAESDELKSRYLHRRLSVEDAMGDREAARRTCDALIDHDPRDHRSYLIKARHETMPEVHLRSIARALELDPYCAAAFRMRAQYLQRKLEGDLTCSGARHLLESVAADYRQSIRLVPTANNQAYRQYYDFLVEADLPAQQREGEITELIESLGTLGGLSSTYLEMLVENCARRGADAAARRAVIDKIARALEVQPRAGRRRFELLLLKALKKLCMNEELCAQLAACDADERWTQSDDYLHLRATVHLETAGHLEAAIQLLQSSSRYRKDDGVGGLLTQCLCLAGRPDEAQKIFDESRANFDPERTEAAEREIASTLGQHERVLDLIRRKQQRSMFPGASAVEETHALLKLARYEEVIDIGASISEPAWFNPTLDALAINVEIARCRQGRKVDGARLRRLVERNATEPSIRMCASLLLDDRKHAAECLSRALNENKLVAHTIRDWAIFDFPTCRAWLNSELHSRGIALGRPYLRVVT